MTGPDTTPVLQVIGLSAHAPDDSQILDDVSFSVTRGSLVGIAGPTGAGKTSLVNALIGLSPISAGAIVLDGHDVSEQDAVRRRIGFVPQEDLLHSRLVLRRTLDYAASLRMPSSACTCRSQRVATVLGDLGLEGQADLRVASLSAGQRKRANVAVELLSQPEVLILDEPTSSLDPGYERTVMTALRGLADRGQGIVAVTHSMQAIAACDRVLFLAAGGHVAFFGRPAEAAEYFGQRDTAELFLSLDSGDGRRWKDRFRSQTLYGLDTAGAAAIPSMLARPPAGAGRGAQMVTLVRRYVELIRSDRRHAAMLAVQGLVLGVLLWTFLGPAGLRHPASNGVGAGPPPSAVGISVVMALCVSWLGSANAVREIVKERRILQGERAAGLSVRAYVGSKFAVLGSMTMVQASVLTAIAVARQHAPGHGAVLGSGVVELVVTAAAAGLAAVALGLLVSALVRTPDKAVAVLPMVVVAEFVLSGFKPAMTWVPGLAQLRDLAGSHWAVEAMGATVTGDAHAWWTSIFALLLLTVAALAATAFLVRRGLRLPAKPCPSRAARLKESLLSLKPSERFVVSGGRAQLGLLGAACVILFAAVGALGMQVTGSGANHTRSTVAGHQAPPHLPAATADPALTALVTAAQRFWVDMAPAGVVAGGVSPTVSPRVRGRGPGLPAGLVLSLELL